MSREQLEECKEKEDHKRHQDMEKQGERPMDQEGDCRSRISDLGIVA